MPFGKMKKASDPYTDFVTLRELLVKSRGKLRATLAANPNLQSYLHPELAKDKDPKVRAGLASNRKLSLEAWNILEKDENPEVRKALRAEHPEPPDPRHPRSH